MIWYMIEDFNGYEINKEGQVRSMKMMYSNPWRLLKLDKNGDYTLTNNFNKRVKISPEELLDLVFNSGKKLYPREDNEIYLGGRNKSFYVEIHQGKKLMDFSKFIKDE